MHYRKILLLCCCILATIVINAQKVKRKGVEPINVSKNRQLTIVFTINQLLGKWQEDTRLEKSNVPVNFTDTIFLNFTNDTTVITRQGTNATLVGTAEIVAPGNVLLAAADVYTILSVSANEIKLDNQDNYIHTFQKVSQFWHDSFGKKAVQ